MAAGNLLAADEVPAAMLAAFAADPAAHIGDRLMAASRPAFRRAARRARCGRPAC